MSTPNVDLLCRTLAHIEANPDEWDQSHWRCGTSMCVAGWACELAGGQWYEDEPVSLYRDELLAEPGDAEFLEDRDGTATVHVADRARRILGLHEVEADLLFDSDNTLDDLRRIVGDLCVEVAS